MQVNSHKLPQEGTREGQGKTVIAANLIKESVMLDKFGNEIDPRTKQVIKKQDE